MHKALEIIDPGSQVDVLVRHLAQSRLETVFERAYSAIFGTQILGLRALIQAGGKVELSVALKAFDDAKSNKVIPTELTFDGLASIPEGI